MHNCIFVVSNKDNLDWTRLTTATQKQDYLYLIFAGDGNLTDNPEEAVLVHFPENLPDNVIEEESQYLLELMPGKSIIAAIHKTPADKGYLNRTKILFEFRCAHTELFSHETYDNFWPIYAQVIKSVEKGSGFSTAIQNLLHHIDHLKKVRQHDALATSAVLQACSSNERPKETCNQSLSSFSDQLLTLLREIRHMLKGERLPLLDRLMHLQSVQEGHPLLPDYVLVPPLFTAKQEDMLDRLLQLGPFALSQFPNITDFKAFERNLKTFRDQWERTAEIAKLVQVDAPASINAAIEGWMQLQETLEQNISTLNGFEEAIQIKMVQN